MRFLAVRGWEGINSGRRRSCLNVKATSEDERSEFVDADADADAGGATCSC